MMKDNINKGAFDSSIWGNIDLSNCKYAPEPENEQIENPSDLVPAREESVHWSAYVAIAAFVMLLSIIVSNGWIADLLH